MNVDMSYYPDGINLKHVKQGDVEDVAPHVAAVWLADGRAREDKMIDAAPAVKAGPQRGEQAHRSGPNVTLVVEQGSSPYPVPSPGNVVPVKLKPAKKR
jgi:hypothetical protein